MYSFGAMLSFTIAHASIVALRVQAAATRSSSTARGRTCRLGGIDWPLFAILGGLGTAARLARRRRPGAGHALGRARLARDRLRRLRALPQARPHAAAAPRPSARRRSCSGRRSGRVPHDRRAGRCARPSPRRRSSPPRGSPPSAGRRIVIVHVLEVPLDLPLDAELPERRGGAPTQLLDDAQALVESYGVRAVTSRLERARSAGPAIVDGGGAPQRRARRPRRAARPRSKRRRRSSGATVDYVLQERAGAGGRRRREAGGVSRARWSRESSLSILIVLGVA